MTDLKALPVLIGPLILTLRSDSSRGGRDTAINTMRGTPANLCYASLLDMDRRIKLVNFWFGFD